MDPKLITTVLLVAVLVWGIGRRMRRTFGRQPVHAARIWVRIGVLTLVGGLVIARGAVHSAEALEALIGGTACGAALAYVGLRHTRFEVTPEGRFYIPHTYIGAAVSALFIGRLLYRFVDISYRTNAMAGADQNLAVMYQRSPLTLAIFAVLVGYYVLFYLGVLARTRVAAPPIGDGGSSGAWLDSAVGRSRRSSTSFSKR